MSEEKDHEKPLASHSMVIGEVRKNTETKPRKPLDSYEECGCVDRWEAEGGHVVGEDQGEVHAD